MRQGPEATATERWLDRLFGTHYLPDGRWPAELGIQGHPVPTGFAAQLVYPLRRS